MRERLIKMTLGGHVKDVCLWATPGWVGNTPGQGSAVAEPSLIVGFTEQQEASVSEHLVIRIKSRGQGSIRTQITPGFEGHCDTLALLQARR